MKDDSFRDFILDQLRDLGHVDCRNMFGGYGLYHTGVFFGIISSGKLYLKTDPATRSEYERRGMEPFRPNAKQTLKSYYEVPVEIIEDGEWLAEWARKAVLVTMTT
jgi:DNA transformation protein and related proteins